MGTAARRAGLSGAALGLDHPPLAAEGAAGWLEETMPADPPLDELRQSFTEWMMKEGEQVGLDEDVVKAYEVAIKEKYKFLTYGDCMLIL